MANFREYNAPPKGVVFASLNSSILCKAFLSVSAAFSFEPTTYMGIESERNCKIHVLISELSLLIILSFKFQRFALGWDKSGTKFVIIATLAYLLHGKTSYYVSGPFDYLQQG